MTDLATVVALWSGGKRDAAERALEPLLRARPDDPAVLRFRAETCAATGRAAEAVAAWRRLSLLCPADASVLRSLGNALLAAHAPADAIPVLRAAIELEPANARARNNLGLALIRAGDTAAAAASLEAAVTIEPGYALAHLNLGLARQAMGLPESARASFQRALEIDPHLTPARVQLSGLLAASDAAAARQEQDRALESHALNLMTVRQHEAAIPVFTQLIERGADLHYLEGTRFHCELQCCDWSRYDATAAALEAQVRKRRHVVLPFSFFVHSDSAEAQLLCSAVYAADRHPRQSGPAPDTARAGSPRIRVAYLSFDFHEHATAYLAAGLFEAHDRSRFETVALSYGLDDHSAMRARLERSVDRFIDVSKKTDREVGELMAALGVQVAVDLKGHTGGARTGIFAQRAAPVQVNFLGYPGTMGADYIDYIVADRHVIPAHHRMHYVEQVIELPQCYQPNDARRPQPTVVPPREYFDLPERGFVFCCFNNVYKIAPSVFDTWMALLQCVDGSVLWLLEGTAAATRNLRAAAAARGVTPERLVFAPHVPLAQHLARYRHADVFLDTWPCNAHTTASDALWMGVPVVTLTGQAFPGRVATSLLHAVGLPGLCTRSLQEYGQLALRLAGAPVELAELKAHLERGRTSFPLFDTRGYCRHLEVAYAEIWARCARGERPRPLVIAARQLD